MSSANFEAKERLEAALGTSLEAVKMAITTDPTARLIWDHSVALVASLVQNSVRDVHKIEVNLEAWAAYLSFQATSPDEDAGFDYAQLMYEKVYKDGFDKGADVTQAHMAHRRTFRLTEQSDRTWRAYLGLNSPAAPFKDGDGPKPIQRRRRSETHSRRRDRRSPVRSLISVHRYGLPRFAQGRGRLPLHQVPENRVSP